MFRKPSLLVGTLAVALLLTGSLAAQEWPRIPAIHFRAWSG